MGFETKDTNYHCLDIKQHLSFVPMGFETRGVVVLCDNGDDLSFVPMGFETAPTQVHPVFIFRFELCPYGI